ncbi:hypothetical protein [Microbulbifer spongiae]|uniref:Uncharacterized protein n=1 Tax=Microbulbifer spongiae TaxID=2944933 RepID=A0ABY9EEX4_9GAMM|nr:hypothetical protein [Microbulbifer sp. MI-G]WKD50598.1 hypothetical protein M8T91_04000 [Microbulbifer sp. MI-G]
MHKRTTVGGFLSNFTHGFHLSSSTINPFTSGYGNVTGHYNDQAFFDENGVIKKQYTYEGNGVGLDVGLSVELVLGFGEGAWEGAFNSFNLSAGAFSGSVYWSPGGGGWWGVSFGPSLGLPGIAFEETVYTPLTSSD